MLLPTRLPFRYASPLNPELSSRIECLLARYALGYLLRAYPSACSAFRTINALLFASVVKSFDCSRSFFRIAYTAPSNQESYHTPGCSLPCIVFSGCLSVPHFCL